VRTFDEKNATADELWDYCMKEYNNRNLISQKLFNGFFEKISLIVKEFKSGSRVLEVGCGAGESSNRIVKMLDGRYFEASDVDPRYIEKLNGMGLQYKVSVESVFSLNRKDKEFDHVIMLEVLEHLDNYEDALKELVRVAKRSIVISVPNEPIWSILNCMRLRYLKNFGNTPGHVNRFSKKSLISLLEKYGKVKKVHTPLPWIIIECEL
jgi:ubiquinone/menaquinone biosynthesis C-methylase UbiE